jgi:lipoprotein-anchoring transpeptidase ErfK/SrfK
MFLINRRAFFAASSAGAALALAGCNAQKPLQVAAATPVTPVAAPLPPSPETIVSRAGAAAGSQAAFTALYPGIQDKFPIAPIRFGVVPPAFWRTEIDYPTREAPGTIIVDPHHHYLYFVESGGRAMRYGVGVGREGMAWAGTANINSKQEWPDWYPPKEMIARQPELQHEVSKLQSGLGVAGGLRNPLGARAMYLWEDNKDTLFRIHGTTEPGSIGKSVSSGCIRMVNQDAIDLYSRVSVGTKVIVLS